MKKELLFGNEAVVRGALEAGVGFSSTYPGTPASEIGDVFAKLSKKHNYYFEYSTNEKVALEAAAGAAFSGVKSLVSMKHYGVNVASDSLYPLVYLECPLIVAVSDDPGCYSSVQTEQDSRWFSRLGHIPTLEPSNSQETKDMTKFAFDFAIKNKIPVLIRLTTRISHTRTPVTLGNVPTANNKGNFIKKPFILGGDQTVSLHKKALEKLEKIKTVSESSNFNFEEKGEGKTGIITSGISYNYVKEVFKELNIKLPLLKIGFSYPFPTKKVGDFIKKLNKVLIVEELDSILEGEVRQINSKMEIHGKDYLPEFGELNSDIVLNAISKLLNKKVPTEVKAEKVEKRLPFLCSGCPHRSTFYAVKKMLGDKVVCGGDIGCYMLGAYPPFNIHDFIMDMGASIGVSHGIAKATGKKTVMFIGDSTFFHAGIPALMNLVYNKSDALVVILDNRFTAMTGHQPNPNTGFTGMGEETKIIDIEEIAKACKVDFVKTSSAYSINQLMKDIKQAYDTKGVSVIVSKGECRLTMLRTMAKKGIKVPKYEIIKQNTKLDELKNFDCPAIKKVDGKWLIDEDLCWGCSVCMQLYPDNIKIKK